MLAMALPIALVGYAVRGVARAHPLRPSRLRARCGHVRDLPQERLLAPVAVVLTLAYFRRRELLKLAPLGMVLVVMVTVLSPGALRSTLDQFVRPDRLDVPTVSDRASDYDAIRPDLWTHLVFGRGWGSYNHETYRILDSEILHRTVEMGLVGLVAFLLMVLSVILSARKTIAGRDPQWAPVALVGAAAAAASSPSRRCSTCSRSRTPTYIFLYTAGMVAVVIASARRASRTRRGVAPAAHEGRLRRGIRRSPAVRPPPWAAPAELTTTPAAAAGRGAPSASVGAG